MVKLFFIQQKSCGATETAYGHPRHEMILRSADIQNFKTFKSQRYSFMENIQESEMIGIKACAGLDSA